MCDNNFITQVSDFLESVEEYFMCQITKEMNRALTPLDTQISTYSVTYLFPNPP